MTDEQAVDEIEVGSLVTDDETAAAEPDTADDSDDGDEAGEAEPEGTP